MEITATIRWKATVCMKVVIIRLPLRVCYQDTGQLLPSSPNMYRKEEVHILSKGKSQAVFAKWSVVVSPGALWNA
jgi:hypothetical protein